MKKLRNKILLAGIHILPAVSDFEICNNIRPYLRQCHLHLETGVIYLPKRINLEQYEEIYRAKGENLYKNGISFSEIVIIESTHNDLSLYLRSGFVLYLTNGSPFIKITNVYPT